MDKVHYSSKKYDYGTPKKLYDKLDKEFRFTVDVCATKKNAKHINYWNRKDNGLIQDWRGHSCFMNPPYGSEIKKWVKKAAESNARGGVVGLLPARTDTAWFHDYIYGKTEIRFLRGRIKFDGADNSAPFPSMIVIWTFR